MTISETAQAGMMAMAVHIREYLIQKQLREMKKETDEKQEGDENSDLDRA